MKTQGWTDGHHGNHGNITLPLCTAPHSMHFARLTSLGPLIPLGGGTISTSESGKAGVDSQSGTQGHTAGT